MNPLPITLANDAVDMIPLVAIAGGILIALVSIIAGVTGRIIRTRAREQTKREVAAYVAEGSMTAEDAERIVKADLPAWEKGDWGKGARAGC